jgi:PAS domain S-box-containing protein
MPAPSRPRTLRSHLTLLVFAAVVPVLIFAALVVALLERQQRTSMERGLRDTARALTVAVDRELISSLSTLGALATSEHLDTGDLRRFYAEAQRVLASHPGWITINLVDLSGQQLINLLRPFGAPLPSSGDLEVVRRTLDTGEPAISDLFVGPVFNAPIVAMTAPVTRGGTRKYGLGVGFDVVPLSRLLAEGKLPPDWVATLIDRKGIIVARTQGIEGLLGKPATPELVAQSRLSEDGSLRHVSRDGIAVYTAYSRSRLSGWTVGLGAPAEAVEAPGRRSLWAIAGGGVVLLLVATALATLSGRRVAGAIASLSASARALGQGEMPSGTRGATIAEVADVEREMAAAARERAEAVAARLKTEEALQESEERTRLIVDRALDAVITIDLQGRITSWNPQAERQFGWPQEEVLGRLLSETIIPPAYREAHERGLAHFRATGEGPVLNQRIELTALHRNGTEFPVELAITPMQAGKITFFSAFLRDISERKRAEEARRESEASFRLLFASNPLPMWVYDVATLYFLEVNAAAVGRYGYSREEFLRMRVTDIRPAEDVPKLKEVVTGLAMGMDHSGTWRHRLKDGRIRDVDIVSHAIEFAGRRAALVVAMDVTELRQTQASLARSTERLQILHEIDRGMIAAEVPAALAEAVLPRLRDLLGVPRAIVSLFDLAKGEAEWLAAAGRRRVRVGPGVRFPLALMGDVEALRRGELQVIDTAALPRTPDAEALLGSGVNTYMVVPMIAGGELIGAVSFGGATAEFPPEQVSIAREAATQLAIALEQARLRERVKRHTDELEQRVHGRTLELSTANERLQREVAERQRAEAEADRANHAKSDFLSRMSHELRTPLNAILGFARLLELDAQRPEDRESVEQIVKAGRHLLGLINEVLDIARIEAGELSLSLEPVRVGDAVQRVLDLARPLATARGIGLETTGLALHPRHLWADQQRLQQVLLNLVSNGIKYNREGGRLTVSCEVVEEGRLRITVTDTGTGIPPALRARLFQPFDRLGAEQRGVEGTGLGLALSKRLVEAMGGTIGVESNQGEGSTFWVELLQTADPGEQQEQSERDASELVTSGTQGGTVLYIEDNFSNLRLVERAMTRHRGVRLIPATQGRLGLELARQHRPDLILLDLHLPDISGEQVLRELQADPRLQRTPVIILSADATPGQVERLVAAGARAYLTKPLDVRQLLLLVDEALPSRKTSDG